MPDMWSRWISVMEDAEKNLECGFKEIFRKIGKETKRIIIIIEFEDEGKLHSS